MVLLANIVVKDITLIVLIVSAFRLAHLECLQKDKFALIAKLAA